MHCVSFIMYVLVERIIFIVDHLQDYVKSLEVENERSLNTISKGKLHV